MYFSTTTGSTLLFVDARQRGGGEGHLQAALIGAQLAQGFDAVADGASGLAGDGGRRDR